jgi:hypothetical protein
VGLVTFKPHDYIKGHQPGHCPTTQGDNTMQRIADYTAPTKRFDGTLTISVLSNGRRHFICEHKVDGKRTARAVAAQYDATPWNF